MESALPQLRELNQARLTLVRQLADSLELSQSALLHNDAAKIARGAAHQAELYRRWSRLESQLRQEQERASTLNGLPDVTSRNQNHEAEWKLLSDRIRHLTRVHASLLRHLNRTLAVLARVAESCEPTYAPNPGLRISTARAGG